MSRPRPGSERRTPGVSRRAFVRSAVAIGGSAALAACLDRETDPSVERGTDDDATLPDRQHAWDEYSRRDQHGNVLLPEHHVLLLCDLREDGEPSTDDRETLESAFRDLERAYVRGSDGLLFTVGYGPEYFARFEGNRYGVDGAEDDADGADGVEDDADGADGAEGSNDRPAAVDLPEPKPLAPFEDPIAEDADVLIHLASDHGSVVLAAEEALKGTIDSINGVDREADASSVLSVTDRRTGFVGDGLPADRQSSVSGIPDSEPIPEDAPLFMGFKSGFRENQASEDQVTIESGPFAGGTTTQLSRIRLNLQQWYEQDTRDQRVGKMFCPVHAESDRVEGAGHNLGTSSRLDECEESAEQSARDRGVVGHSQKLERVREGDEPTLLRRDFNSTDGDEPGVHFLSHQARIADFVEAREAMNATELVETTAIGQTTNNGILQYLTVLRRGNFLVPPRDRRSLPTPHSD